MALRHYLGLAISIAACTGWGDVPEPAELALKPTDVEPAPAGLRRLSLRQYTGTVRMMFGEAAAEAAMPPGDHSLAGFDAVGAAELALSDKAIQRYEASAMAVAAAFMADGDRYVATLPCVPSGPDDGACYAAAIQSLGRVAWRRPLSDDEVAPIVALAESTAGESGAFEDGLIIAIGTLLQSPYFVYQIEIGDEEGFLTPGELVARMSFTLLDRGPNEVLLDMAQQGALDSEEQIRDAARSMLLHDDARHALRGFFAEAWRLREVTAAAKDVSLFTAWTPMLAASAQEEVYRLIDHVVWKERADFRELLTADYAFVNSELAGLYDIQGPPEGEWIRVILPEEQARSGLLGSAAFLARLAHPQETSPTRRGQFIQDRLRCVEIPPPPPDVEAALPDVPAGEDLTKKELLAATHSEPLCASCHDMMDPLGLALERFDAVGRFRATDGGKAIDPSGEVADLGAFADGRELGALLADDPAVASCIVRLIYRDALGHVDGPGQEAALRDLDARFEAVGHRLDELLVELTASLAFRMVGPPR